MTRYPRTLLATCCIPWRSDDTLDETIFRRSVGGLLQRGLRDLYLFGTAGEGYAVTDAQFERVTCVFVEEMQAHGATPMVGIISLSLPTIIERIERAITWGVQDFQISLPSWGTLSDRELTEFFEQTCGRFEQCRFLHYNLQRSGRLVTPPEYSMLAEKHPNLVATKNSTSDIYRIHALLQDAPQLRHFFTEVGYAYGLLIGEPGFLVSIASSNPQRATEYFNAGVQRDIASLLAMQQELFFLLDELIRVVSGQAHMDGAFDKMFSKLLDEEFPLRLLPPYQGTSQEAFEAYRQVLCDRLAQWLPEN